MSAEKYEIRTLRDIFNLPTPEAMERCLNELREMMVSSRAYCEMLTDVAKVAAASDGKGLPDSKWDWPESMEWTDDGSIVGSEIKLCDPADPGRAVAGFKYSASTTKPQRPTPPG